MTNSVSGSLATIPKMSARIISLQDFFMLLGNAFWCCWLGVFILFSSSAAYAETSRAAVLARSRHPFEQTISLIQVLPFEQKALCFHSRLGWEPSTKTSSPPGIRTLRFDFDGNPDDPLHGSMRAQFWISFLAVTMTWQQSWVNGHWTVAGAPGVEESGAEAMLAVGLIATASNIPIPKDVIIMGCLYPDGSIGPASQILKRIETAAASGIKRVIVPNLQHFEISSNGSLLNVHDFAKASHVECFFVDHLAEAARIALQREISQPAEIRAPFRSEGRLLDHLELRCKKELEALQATVRDWPEKPDQLTALNPPLQKLWKEVFQNYNDGLDAYRGGSLYVAREKLNRANACLKAVEARNRNEKIDFKVENARATALRQIIVTRMSHPSVDRDELQSALVLAEEDDWLYEINARIEGSQILARQAFASHSHASPQQKQMAQVAFQNALAEAEYQLQDPDYYRLIDAAIQPGKPVRVRTRDSAWLSQLTSIFLSAAEFLTQGIRLHANEYREALLFDPRLATYARVLRDAHMEWEEAGKRSGDQESAAQMVENQVGFVPGPAYSPPAPPVPPPPPQSLSDTARTLIWVNRYCEVAMLEQKYLGPGGAFEPASMEWKNLNRATLQNMLQNAERGARIGIASAERVGVNPAILVRIYERASHLRASHEDQNRLEALRQYWRCSVLGNMCRQLVLSSEAADTEIATVQAASSPDVRPSELPFPISTNTSPIWQTTTPMFLPNEVAQPPSVPAISLTPDELLRMENGLP